MTQVSGGATERGSRRNAVREASYIRRVKLLEQKGRYDEAIGTLEKAIELAPGKVSHCMMLADLYRAQRKIDSAILAIRRALELDPSDSNSQEALLQIYVEAGQFDEAIRECKRILKRQPRSFLALDVLGLAYMQKGELHKALQVITKLIHIYPSDAASHFKKAVLFQQMGDCARAVEEFSRVIDLDPHSEISVAAQQAVGVLDSFQLRQIAALAADDRLFLAKLLRDPDHAVAERGFLLSLSGLSALRQIDFNSIPSHPQQAHRYYH